MGRKILAALMVLACACLASNALLGIPVQATPFEQRIPAADYSKFKSIREAKYWANPFLLIRGDGIEVISSALSPERKLVSLSELRGTLIRLPNSAWPYGRIVALAINNLPTKNSELVPGKKAAAQEILKA